MNISVGNNVSSSVFLFVLGMWSYLSKHSSINLFLDNHYFPPSAFSSTQFLTCFTLYTHAAFILPTTLKQRLPVLLFFLSLFLSLTPATLTASSWYSFPLKCFADTVLSAVSGISLRRQEAKLQKQQDLGFIQKWISYWSLIHFLKFAFVRILHRVLYIVVCAESYRLKENTV